MGSTVTAFLKLKPGTGFIFIILFNSCNSDQSKINHDDEARSLFPRPRSVSLNLDSGYRINPFNGDSIKPVKNANGEIIKTGVPVPVSEQTVDITVADPVEQIEAIWSEEGLLTQNIYQVPERTGMLIDESKLEHFELGKDTSTYVLKNSKGDTIPTGIPIPVQGISVARNMPVRTEGLPLSFSSTAAYGIKYLNTYHGLKSSNIHSVLEDKRGCLWIATREGLVCYDGKSILTFTENEGLYQKNVLFLFEDRHKNIWLDYGSGVVSKYDGKSFTHFVADYRQGLVFLGNNSIIEDKKGNIWFRTLVNGVTCYDGKHFIHYSKKQGLRVPYIRTMFEDSKGNLWFGTHGDGAYRFDGSIFTYFRKENGLNHNIVSAIVEDRQGKIWLGTDSGAACYDGNTLTQYYQRDGLSGNFIGSIKIDTNGNLWFGTYERGVTVFNGKSFTQITEKEGLTGNRVFDLDISPAGNYWIATENGVSHFKETNFRYFFFLSSQINNGLTRILKDHQNKLWVGASSDGLLVMDGMRVRRLVDKHSILKNSYISCLMEDRKGNIWIGTNGRGLFIYNGKELQHYPETGNVPGRFITALFQDSKGNIWIGTSLGLFRYNGKAWMHLSEKSGLSNNFIFCIREDHTGNIWLGSRAGLSCYNGKAITHFTEKEGLPNNNVRKIVEDRKGSLWLSTNEGIAVYSGNEIISISEKEGLLTRIPGAIVEDHLGNMWVEYLNGVCRISYSIQKNKTDTYLPERIAPDEIVLSIGQKDGLGFQISDLLIDNNNQLWVTGDDGLVMEDLNKFYMESRVPKVFVSEIIINDHYLDFQSKLPPSYNKVTFARAPEFYNFPENLELPYDLNQLTFYLSADEQLTNDRLLFTYKMEGLDENWSKPSKENRIHYKYIPPGAYTFKVQVLGRSQVWSEVYTYSFIIAAPFWQQVWFWVLLFCLLVSFTGWMIKRRIDAIKRREQEKTESVKRMAELELQSLRAQLNPHFMFNSLNAIQELILMEENEKSQSYLARFAKLLRMLLENAEKPFIPLQRELDFLQLYLSLETLRIPNLNYYFHLDPLVDTEEIMIPNMILQPYIENSIWHGLSHKDADKQLSIRVEKRGAYMVYEIEDNGVGRNRAAELKSQYRKEHKSKGMELLSKRFKLLAKEYGSEIITEVSDIDKEGMVSGTLVTIKVSEDYQYVKIK